VEAAQGLAQAQRGALQGGVTVGGVGIGLVEQGLAVELAEAGVAGSVERVW
jgi:hypothetical protein